MLILLDLDGTLTDPYDGITRSVAFALAEMNLPGLSEPTLRGFIGPPLQDSFAALGMDDASVARAVRHYRERFATHGLYENQLYEGILPMLAALAEAPCRLAVATSKPTPFAQRIVDHFGLAEHLELVVGATLDGTRRHKADVIAAALAGLDADPADAVMVGDRAHDVLGAHAHGMRSIGVGWGYAEPGELEAAGAHTIVTTPADLVDVLAG